MIFQALRFEYFIGRETENAMKINLDILMFIFYIRKLIIMAFVFFPFFRR